MLAIIATLQFAQAQEAGPILKTSGIKGGFVVHVGCGDGKLTAKLRANESYLVHGLDTSAANVEKARKHISSLGLYGKIAVDQFDGKHLPYGDNVVNLLVASVEGQVSSEEIMRVLAPKGVALVGGKKTIKPRPSNIDDWTHYLHGPDNNAVAQDTVVGPPRHLQWVGGPRWSRSHEHLPSLTALVSAGGRIFYVFDEGPAATVAAPARWFLVARDAFSGVVLWKRPLIRWEQHLSHGRYTPACLPRRLVAMGERVYVTMGFGEPLSALDAATGKTVKAYDKTEGTLEIICDQGVLYLLAADAEVQKKASTNKRGSGGKFGSSRVLALNAENGKLLWSKSDGETDAIAPTTLAVSDGRVFFQNAREVVCLKAGSGQKLWAAARPATLMNWGSALSPTLVIHKGVVLSAEASAKGELMAFSAETGKKLWSSSGLSQYRAPADVLVTGELVWVAPIVTARGGIKNVNVSMPRDLMTGKPREHPPGGGRVPIGSNHHRCYRNKATSRYLITGRNDLELIDVKTVKGTQHHWTRGMCAHGVMPANGLIYVPQHPCACFRGVLLNGFNALAAERTEVRDQKSEVSRLEKGPAYGKKAPLDTRSSDWPTYRADAARSGRARCTVPTQLKRAWQAEVGGRLTPPVIAGGKIYTASIDTHTVHALDAGSGKPAWSYIVGGRIDTAPTVHKGTVLFGSADGWVYCLNGADGALAWRFRVAPGDRRLVAQNQVESIWPVHGGVMITKGNGSSGAVAWCVAGRSSFLDGGMYLCRLNPATGKLLSETRLDTLPPKGSTGPPKRGSGRTVSDGSLPDVLSCDGSSVFMRFLGFDMQGKRQNQRQVARHLFSESGFLDDDWFHRSYWVLDVRPKMIWVGRGAFHPAENNPSGRILSLTEKSVFGYGVDGYGHPGLKSKKHTVAFRLFAADRNPTAGTAETGKKKTKGKKKGKRKRNVCTWPTHWERTAPLFVRAMTVTDSTLFIAGPPDPGHFKDMHDALTGKKGGLLQAVAKTDGKQLSELKLDSPPVFDGMAAAGGRLYLSCIDGKLYCFAQ